MRHPALAPSPMSDMHFLIGDSAATMRLLCGAQLHDACWTRNPRAVTCPRCLEFTLPAAVLGLRPPVVEGAAAKLALVAQATLEVDTGGIDKPRRAIPSRIAPRQPISDSAALF